MTCVRERQQMQRTGSCLVVVVSLLVFLLGLPAWSSGAYQYGLVSSPLPEDWVSLNGINDSRMIVGTAFSQGFISSATSITPTMLNYGSTTEALGINNAGIVVGYGTSSSGTQGFIYTTGPSSGFVSISSPSFLTDFRFQGINSGETIVGYGPTKIPGQPGPSAAFSYSAGVYTQILPTGLSDAQAFAINQSGAIVGWGNKSVTGLPDVLTGFDTGGVFTLFLLSASGGTVHIGGINNNALVGWVEDGAGHVLKGFVARSNGSYEEILPSIQSLSGTWTNVQVTGISESGIIVGYGDYDGNLTGFIATAVPLPASFLLFSTGLAAVVGFRRFRRK